MSKTKSSLRVGITKTSCEKIKMPREMSFFGDTFSLTFLGLRFILKYVGKVVC